MSFVSAGFLLGLLALAIPWWLHRRESRSGTPQPVASLYLLRQASVPQARQKELRYRGLLALRLLLLLLLAFTFAQPVVERWFSADPAGSPSSRLVVVDVSASMAPVWRQALVQARELLQGRAGLVAANTQLTLLSGLTDDPQQQQAALQSLQPSATALSFADLGARLSSLADSLAAPGEVVAVHLISDFQASQSPDRFNALVSGVTHPLTLHPLSAEQGNWFIESLSPDQLTVRGAGTAAATVPVRVFVEDELLIEENLAVAANGRATLRLPVVDVQRHDLRLTAAIQVSDAVAVDNERYLVLEAPPARLVPVLADDPSQRVYIDAALAASGWESVADPLAGQVIIAVDPLSSLPLLENLLRDGGRALIFAGARTRNSGRVPVLGESLATSLMSSAAHRVQVLDSTHPVLNPLLNWDDLLVFQHLAPSQPLPDARVLLALDNGSPLLLEAEVGRGRALLFTTGLSPDWTNLATLPGFVTLLTRAMAYLREDLLPNSVEAGQTLTLPPGNTQLIAADGTRMLTLQQSAGGATVALRTPGHYEVRSAAAADAGRRYVAVNVDPLESDLTPMSQQLLERWQVAPAADIKAAPDTAAAPAEDATAALRRADLPLAPWLLAGLLLLALLEPLFANGPPSAREVT